MAASIQRSYYGFTAIYQRENKTFNFEITPFIIFFSFVLNHYYYNDDNNRILKVNGLLVDEL